jgi:TerC family integral membrane protein
MIHWWAWAAVIGFVLIMLAIDLLVFQKEAHEVTTKEAAIWSGIWITCGLAFGVVIFFWLGHHEASEYMAGYLIEKSLSVDNIFVFALIFAYFQVPAAYQHRVLFWGVLGALVCRAAFIAAGSAILDAAHWTIYIFGAFLVITAIRMLRHGDTQVDPGHNPVLRLMRRFVPMTPEYRSEHFFVREGKKGRRIGTPLLAVLVVIETTDIIFAVDSIPAIFAVTKDTFLVFTSNVFAILGLRALYFLLAGMIGRFVHLKTGLAVVLAFVGVKMLITDLYHVPIWASLAFIAIAIGGSVVLSLRATPPEPEPELHRATIPDPVPVPDATVTDGTDRGDP